MLDKRSAYFQFSATGAAQFVVDKLDAYDAEL